MEAFVPGGSRKKEAEKQKKKGEKLSGRCEFPDFSDESSEDSSDDDQGVCDSNGDDDFATYFGLSPKVRQIIPLQDEAEFSTLLKPKALQVATKADLYKLLGRFRAERQCVHGLCRVEKLPVAHDSSPEALHGKQIPIVLPDLRDHSHLSISMTQRVTPGAIR